VSDCSLPGGSKTGRPSAVFGFIERDDHRDVFVHASKLKAASIDALEVGDRVRFDCAVDKFGRLRCSAIALEEPPSAAAD
jgi:cold shock CspA family protein